MLSDHKMDINTKTSHTMEIYREAHRKIAEYFGSRHKRYNILSRYDSGVKPFVWKLLQWWNVFFFHKIGLAILHIDVYNEVAAQYVYSDFGKDCAIKTMYYGVNETQKLDEAYKLLADDESRNVWDWFLKFRFAYAYIGRVAEDIYPYPGLSLNRNVRIKRDGAAFKVNGYIMDNYFEIQNIWIEEQYLLEGKCEPQQGDVIIDAGGFHGETAIWFADRVGKSGRVHTFEASVENYQKLTESITKNHLEGIIIPINEGLWSEVTDLFISDRDFTSTCSESEGDLKIKATTIDAYVQREKLTRVNFIKMDIEGAELNALKGASQTIMKFKPKLAVSIYHLPGDIYEIPVFIKSLVPEYNLYLSHKHNDWSETKLFASIGEKR